MKFELFQDANLYLPRNCREWRVKGHWKKHWYLQKPVFLQAIKLFLLFSNEKIDFHRAACFSLTKACNILAKWGTKDIWEGKLRLHDDLLYFTKSPLSIHEARIDGYQCHHLNVLMSMKNGNFSTKSSGFICRNLETPTLNEKQLF